MTKTAANIGFAKAGLKCKIENLYFLSCPEIGLHKSTCKNEKDRTKKRPNPATIYSEDFKNMPKPNESKFYLY